MEGSEGGGSEGWSRGREEVSEGEMEGVGKEGAGGSEGWSRGREEVSEGEMEGVGKEGGREN